MDCADTQVTEVKVSAIAFGFRSFMIEKCYSPFEIVTYFKCFNLSYNLLVVLVQLFRLCALFV